MYVAPRTCTVVDEGEHTVSGGKNEPLNENAESAAYVLIAEPGAGKTTAFRTEAAKQGGTYITVRNFLRRNKPEWRDSTLFLDGLDETRAGSGDARSPLDDVIRKLDSLDCPRFRLSCRWRYWLAANDREGLREVSPDGAVTVIRLDPLSKGNIRQILIKNHGIEDAEGFINAARQRGIDNLLTNPQNLDLLAKAVVQGTWPESRRDTFEQACRILVREPNSEHLAADPSTADSNALIEAAGRLCAVQILAGNAGYTLPELAEPDEDYPSVTEVDADPGARNRQVLGTRLFSGVAEGQLAPAHRQIAEYLAARHVSRLLDDGLPLGRVLALITGFDGELLAGLKNFASWLAVHNKRSRGRLSRLDPSGMIYAGDRDTYSPEEKRQIVLNLRRQWDHNAGASRPVGKVAGIGAIVSAEIEDTLREILSGAERDHAHQCYVLLLMQMLADGDPLPPLGDLLEAIVRESTWYPSIRCGALDVLTEYAERDSFNSAALQALVRDIDGGSIEDPGDELLGILLKHLFPRILSMHQVLPYLRAPQLIEQTGEYSRFWTEHVIRRSTTEQLAELLDAIAADGDRFKSFMKGKVGSNTRMARLPVETLDRVLRVSRGNVGTHRLYNWLRKFSDGSFEVLDRDVALLKSRLLWDREGLKALIAHGVDQCVGSGEECIGLVDRHLFGARPFGYGRWCMGQAIAVGGRPDVESFYLSELVDCMIGGQGARDLTGEEVRATLSSNKPLLKQFDRVLERRRGPKSSPADQTAAHSPNQRQRQPGERALTDAPPSVEEAGQVSRKRLYQAAEAYLGVHDRFAGKTPRERLGAFAGASSEVVDVIVAQLEATLGRADLPDCQVVVRSFDAQRVNLLVLPFVAGLHSLEQSGRLVVGDLSEDQVRLAMTILYTLPAGVIDPDSAGSTSIYRPQWFLALLKHQPELVARALCSVAVTKLQTGVQICVELYELRYAEDHQQVAKVAAVPLLQRFPPAKSDSALQALCWTLHSAIVNGDRAEVSRLARDRVDRGGLERRERTCWILVGFLVDPEHWRDDFRTLPDDEVCSKSFGMFLAAARVRRDDLVRDLEPSDVTALVELAGAALTRHGIRENAYLAVSDLVSSLGNDTSVAATEALNGLSEAPKAQPWLGAIAFARLHHVQKRREHEFRYCNIQQVVQTLGNRSPANVGDLAALVLDELNALAQRIRQSPTSDWRQHWNVDRYNRPTAPKPEDACRDALLSDLQERLAPRGVDAQPEGVYANDRKADIRVSFAGFNVPVEIKRSCHPDVWTAIGNQLTASYTPDPGAAGFGIYLVFWFGNTEACRPTKCGSWNPTTPDEVKQKLYQSLSDRERDLISICVVDVSVPPEKVMGTPAA